MPRGLYNIMHIKRMLDKKQIFVSTSFRLEWIIFNLQVIGTFSQNLRLQLFKGNYEHKW